MFPYPSFFRINKEHEIRYMEKSVKSWMKNWVDLIKNQSLNKPQEEWVELECLPGVMFKGLRVESVGSEIATDENKLSISWVYSDIDFTTEKKQVEDGFVKLPKSE